MILEVRIKLWREGRSPQTIFTRVKEIKGKMIIIWILKEHDINVDQFFEIKRTVTSLVIQ